MVVRGDGFRLVVCEDGLEKRKLLMGLEAPEARARRARDLTLQRSRYMMLDEFGDTYLTLGDLEQALKAYRDSLAIRERLAAVAPPSSVMNSRRFMCSPQVKDHTLAHR